MDATYASLSIEEEDEGGLIIEGDGVEDGRDGTIDFRFCLVGRFLTDKVINFPAIHQKNMNYTLPNHAFIYI